jgi:hypothetical protein
MMSAATIGPGVPLAQAILAFLSRNGPSKAKAIAKALGVETKEVNSLLYGQLKGRVRSDSQYKWTLVGSDAAESAGGAFQPDGPASKLARYYLECLAEGDGGEISVWAKSSFGQLDYVEVRAFPGTGKIAEAFENEGARALIGRCRRPSNRLALKLGMPVLL